MLKDLLLKENRNVSMMNKDAKKERMFYMILFFVVYTLAAFSMFEFMYELCNIIGCIVSGTPSEAIKELIRVLPMMLTTATFILICVFTHNAYVAVSADARKHIWKKNSIAVIVLAVIMFLYIIVQYITGLFKFVSGGPTLLYPFDILLLSCGFIAFGYFGLKYVKVLETKKTLLPFGPKVKGITKVFMVISFMIALFSSAAIFYSTYVMDWAHGNLFYNFMLIAAFGCAVLQFFMYKLVYCEAKNEFKVPATNKLGLKLLIFNVCIFALYLVSVEVENEAPNLNAFGLLPIEFTASFNAFLPLFGLNNIVAPLVATLRKKK